ncbi:MAG: hypothetical protein IJG63_00580 [Oscillospiraceae bacterium]|nr:hypothetical protein [Oscillospiraceae bacterium]
MNIRFVKLNPTENITLLVLNPVPRQHHKLIASKLMSLYPDAEQVGYLEPAASSETDASLQMMGGEFCGNAAMATASYVSHGRACIKLDVSGADRVVTCRVRNTPRATFGCVDMPLPVLIRDTECPVGKLTEVRFKGITHYICEHRNIENLEKADIERSLLDIAAADSADAIGFVMYDPFREYIKPLVYVRPTESLVWERGCGSGSAAVGAYLSHRKNCPVNVCINQPGGIIRVDTECDADRITALRIEGKIEIQGEYEVDIDI